MLDLPRVGTPVYVEDVTGVNYRSRLEEIDGETLKLASPLETTDITVPAAGHRFDVYWAQTRSRVILPCKLLGVADAAPYRWVLAVNGPPRQSNRREYVRGGGNGGPVRLAVAKTDEAVEGRLLDISECGLRCWVPREPKVGPSKHLVISVKLGKDEVDLPAAVVDVRDAFGEPGKHVILSFQVSERLAQVIRKHVFAWEIAERRQLEMS